MTTEDTNERELSGHVERSPGRLAEVATLHMQQLNQRHCLRQASFRSMSLTLSAKLTQT